MIIVTNNGLILLDPNRFHDGLGKRGFFTYYMN